MKVREVHKRTARINDPCEDMHYGALKGINNDVIPEGYEGYAESNPDRPIDAFLSQIGVYKRMTLDVMKVGFLTKILVEKKRILKEKYLEELEKQ